MECIGGLDSEAQGLLMDVFMCALSNGCLGSEDMMGCLMESCQAEMIACMMDT